MAHAQKPDSVSQRNGRVHLYRRGCQFSRVLAFLQCGSGENDCSNTGWTVPSQAEDCWLPTPFTSFPFTSPPVRRRVPSDSVSTLLTLSPKYNRTNNIHSTYKTSYMYQHPGIITCMSFHLCYVYYITKCILFENLSIKEKLSSHLIIVKPCTFFQGG